jgi:hypothetical protein
VGRFYPQECGEDEGNAVANFLVRMFDDASRHITHQTYGQAQGQLTSPGLADQTRVQTHFDRVKFQFSDQAFEPQDQTTVGCGRVVNCLLISNEATAVSAHIKKLIPIGAVARQACDIISEDDADLAKVDARHQFLETRATISSSASDPKVGVDDLNLGSIPAERVSTLG